MPNDDQHEVTLSRVGKASFVATNARGGQIRLGPSDGEDFSPVELLLAAVAGCTAIDVDLITGKRAEPTSFDLTSRGRKVRDDDGNHLTDLEVTFTVRFPEGESGDAARESLPRAIQQSHDRLCTVSRTVILPTPITSRADDGQHD